MGVRSLFRDATMYARWAILPVRVARTTVLGSIILLILLNYVLTVLYWTLTEESLVARRRYSSQVNKYEIEAVIDIRWPRTRICTCFLNK